MNRPPRNRAPINEALRTALGAPRVVRRLASSPRSRVWLVEFDTTPAVVKQIVGGPDAPARYAREAAALALAARANPPIVPAVLGTDPHSRVLVLEYVESRGPGPEWVIDYARALARLHATTSAQDDTLPRSTGPSARDIAAFLTLARHLNVPTPARAEAQLEQVCARLEAGVGHALLHGDPCPGNDLHTASGVRFVDLELAALGNGLAELAYLRIGFPTCWCVTDTPRALIDQAEHAYREQWSTDTGTEPGGDLADHCVGWLIRGDALVERADRDGTDHLARATRGDWRWGTTTARGRLLHRTAVVAALSGTDAHLADVARLCRDLHESMRRHWPELVNQPVPTTRIHES